MQIKIDNIFIWKVFHCSVIVLVLQIFQKGRLQLEILGKRGEGEDDDSPKNISVFIV